MGARLPFAIEIVFLVLVLPIAFAYLFSIAGVALMCVRTTLRSLFFRHYHRPTVRTPPRTADPFWEFFPTALGIHPSHGTRRGS